MAAFNPALPNIHPSSTPATYYLGQVPNSLAGRFLIAMSSHSTFGTSIFNANRWEIVEGLCIRTFAYLGTLVLSALDTLIWTLRTITIYDAVVGGKEHLRLLTSSVLSPIGAFSVLCGNITMYQAPRRAPPPPPPAPGPNPQVQRTLTLAALETALITNNMPEVTRLIQQDPSLTTGHAFLKPSLVFSATSPEAIRFLIQNGADPHKKDLDGRDALFFASTQLDLQCMNELINHKLTVGNDFHGNHPSTCVLLNLQAQIKQKQSSMELVLSTDDSKVNILDALAPYSTKPKAKEFAEFLNFTLSFLAYGNITTSFSRPHAKQNIPQYWEQVWQQHISNPFLQNLTGNSFLKAFYREVIQPALKTPLSPKASEQLFDMLTHHIPKFALTYPHLFDDPSTRALGFRSFAEFTKAFVKLTSTSSYVPMDQRSLQSTIARVQEATALQPLKRRELTPTETMYFDWRTTKFPSDFKRANFLRHDCYINAISQRGRSLLGLALLSNDIPNKYSHEVYPHRADLVLAMIQSGATMNVDDFQEYREWLDSVNSHFMTVMPSMNLTADPADSLKIEPQRNAYMKTQYDCYGHNLLILHTLSIINNYGARALVNDMPLWLGAADDLLKFAPTVEAWLKYSVPATLQ